MKFIVKPLVLVLALAVAFVQPPWWGQSTDPDAGFTTSQLEQLVAPVSLYPDSLLMQLYMASTYPLEVMEAERWVSRNSGLSGDALDEALKGQSWDISVKSVCHFPDILTRMVENLDWTQDLGDAFLEQEADLLDATQRMRQKAYDSGNLQSGKEQTVTVKEEKIIVIEPSSPEVVYVPAYNPTVVYGPSWHYSSWYYPGMYYYPPGARLFTFTAGVMIGSALWGGCNWGWGRSYSNVNVNIYNNYNKRINNNWNRTNISNKGGNRPKWQHKPEHRKGVKYKNRDTARRYGGSGSRSRVTRDQARGFDGNRGQGGRGSAQQRPAQGNRQDRNKPDRTSPGRTKPGDRGSAQQRPAQGGRQDRAGAQQRPAQTGRSAQRPKRGNAMSGAGRNSSMERSSSKRGSASRAGTGGSKKRSGSSRNKSQGSRNKGGKKRQR